MNATIVKEDLKDKVVRVLVVNITRIQPKRIDAPISSKCFHNIWWRRNPSTVPESLEGEYHNPANDGKPYTLLTKFRESVMR